MNCKIIFKRTTYGIKHILNKLKVNNRMLWAGWS